MNERIKELAKEAGVLADFGEDIKEGRYIISGSYQSMEKFAELIVQECINTLEFHGFDDAVPYVKWMATNKLGVKE